MDISLIESAIWVNALWDTGAMCSCISKRCAEKLRLKQSDVATMGTASHIVESPIYSAHLLIPNFPTFTFLELLEYQEHVGDCDIIIGMDIISQGDLAITHLGGKTFLSFRIPSLQTIDFEADLRQMLKEKDPS
ncbi:MAG: hypothetical protein AAB316_25125 [Bacteroidota bacterium]